MGLLDRCASACFGIGGKGHSYPWLLRSSNARHRCLQLQGIGGHQCKGLSCARGVPQIAEENGLVAVLLSDLSGVSMKLDRRWEGTREVAGVFAVKHASCAMRAGWMGSASGVTKRYAHTSR